MSYLRHERAGLSAPGPFAYRYDPDLHKHQAGSAQARGVVLRGESDQDPDRVRTCTRSMFEEHSNVPKTWSEKSERNRTGGPNGIRTRVSALRGPCPGPLDDGAGQPRRARR